MRNKLVKIVFILIVIMMAITVLCLTNDVVKETFNVGSLGVVAVFWGMIIISISVVIIYFRNKGI